MNDLRFAFRQLLKNPGFTAVAVLTLALGIGVNSAVFSFVDAILLKPLPYPGQDRLVRLFESNLENGWHKSAIGAPVVGEWRRQSTVFEGIAACEEERFSLTGGDQPAVLPGARVSANTFSLLGIKPLMGRDFLPDEENPGQHRVALLSTECWQSRFGADVGIVGRSITLNGESFEVIGVMPSRIQYPKPDLAVWTALAFTPDRLRQRHNHHYSAMARLKNGVSLAVAQAEMNTIASRMEAADGQNRGWGAELYSMREIAVGDSGQLLWTLLASVGFVLLIACSNIANLLLSRSAARAKEFAIRTALGASRRRVFVQLLSESLVLAVAGGVAGFLLAQLGLPLLLNFSPPDLPRISEGVHLNGWTLGFTVGISLLAGMLFGFAPAWQISRQMLSRDLNDSSRGSSAGAGRRRLRSALIVSEVALSLMLLIAAGLMIRSFTRLLSQDLGYRTDNLVTIPIELPEKRYPGRMAKAELFERLRERVMAIPGVDAAALVYGLPLGTEQSSISVVIAGAPTPRPGESLSAGYSQISPGYFQTMGIPVLRGREFTQQDRTNSTPVLIVDETFARHFNLGENPVGQLVDVGDGTANAEVVGLVKDVRRRDMAADPRGEMYRPYLQNCWGFMNLTLRTRRGPMEIGRAVRAELDQLDKDIPIEHVRTMTQLADSAVAQRRLSVHLLGGFAGMALLLTAIGLYGVLAYNVRQRSQEIGIRMALGAQRADVMTLVLREGMLLLAVGLGVGMVGAVALTRLLRGLLFGVTTTDPLTYLSVPFLLAAVALIACWVPARRAASVKPMDALRAE